MLFLTSPFDQRSYLSSSVDTEIPFYSVKRTAWVRCFIKEEKGLAKMGGRGMHNGVRKLQKKRELILP